MQCIFMVCGNIKGTMATTMADTSNESGSGDSVQKYQSPCRLVSKMKTTCPQCHRRINLKTLRYTHRCTRTFDVKQRALEQKEAADAALKARMEKLKKDCV